MHSPSSVLPSLFLKQFLAFDTQLLLGNKRYTISPEEYIFATLSLYLDIIYLFSFLLQIMGGGRDWGTTFSQHTSVCLLHYSELLTNSTTDLDLLSPSWARRLQGCTFLFLFVIHASKLFKQSVCFLLFGHKIPFIQSCSCFCHYALPQPTPAWWYLVVAVHCPPVIPVLFVFILFWDLRCVFKQSLGSKTKIRV